MNNPPKFSAGDASGNPMGAGTSGGANSGGPGENPYTSSGAVDQPLQATLVGAPQMRNPEGDATGGIIPYKNPKALIAYYMGIIGLLPVMGLPLSVAAVVLGIMGLKERKRQPAIKGSVHAWIGIVLGVLATGYNTLIVIGVVLALLARNQF